MDLRNAPPPASAAALSRGHVLGIARRFVEDARAGRDTSAVRAELAALDVTALAVALADDPARIAFWVNVYNGAVRARLLADPAAYRRRLRFFSRPAVTVAGRGLSPNAIEHGILRRSAFLGGLGYLHNPRPSRFERLLRVDRVDPRVHFALNCGARSCPPFAAWDADTLDADLDRATAAYLAAECAWSDDGRVLTVPRLLRWYRGDVGGRAGILDLLRTFGIIDPAQAPRLSYGDYDWTVDVGGASPFPGQAPRARSAAPAADPGSRVRPPAPQEMQPVVVRQDVAAWSAGAGGRRPGGRTDGA